MAPRRFAVGDRVRLNIERYRVDSLDDLYEIVRLLPALAGVWHYRIKRVGDVHERAASEPQLVKVDGSLGTIALGHD